MPSDIRSFFGGKGNTSSQNKSVFEDPPHNKPTKPKGRGKRKVVSDSEDEGEGPTPKKATPKKTLPKTQVKRESPAGVVTTTSDYFASSGKTKPIRSTPTKFKKIQEDKITPVQKRAPARKGTSSERHSNGNLKSENAVDKDILVLADDRNNAEDVSHAEFESHGKGKRDEYEESDIKDQARQARKKGLDAREKRNAKEDEDGFIQELVNGTTSKDINSGRKRKSKALENQEEEYEEEDDAAVVSGKNVKSSTRKKSPARKSTAKKAKKEEIGESKEMREILNSIPTVQAPSPSMKEPREHNFRSFAPRSEPAPSAGSKETPIGAENCLAGLTFVFTGLLDALGREEGIALVKRYGGKVTTSPSTKTNYVVLGNEAGPKKLEVIAKHNLKTINEDGLFELIRRLPANGGDSKAAAKYEEKKQKEADKVRDMAAEMERQEQKAGGTGGTRNAIAAGGAIKQTHNAASNSVDNRLWTVKYAPTAPSMVCGNKSQVDKLQAWLRAWRSNANTKFKKGGRDGHGAFRAVIIHGPPGIGKTTAAHLVAKLEGYDVIESNASDTRSKKLVETGLKGVLDTTSLMGYFAGDNKKVENEKKKLVLIMDEVDGMSAGDRGGVGALASVCKKTNVPMILICNDRKLPKMKPFDYVTYDLPFRRPTTEQIRARIMTICYREGLKIPPNVVDALIEGSRADIRQIINMISTAKLDQEAIDFNQGKEMSKSWEKHVILKPWDIVSKILGGGMFSSGSTSTLNDKIELYFNDHEFSSLMLEENYLKTTPILSTSYSGKERNLKLLELSDKAAESISDGDLVDRMIHGSQQQWSLMPTHAVFSFVRPASFISGSLAGHGNIAFTSWLGNNRKLMRFIKEIQGHMRLRASGDRHEIRQEYLPVLWYKLVKQLSNQGKGCLDDVIALMDSYFLTRDDFDAILELGLGPMDAENAKIDTQTKTAFTRLYNSESHPLPFMKASNVLAPKRVSKEKPDLEEAIDESDEGEDPAPDEVIENEEEELDLKKDKYVQVPKKTAPKKKSGKKGVPDGKFALGDESENEIEHMESEEDAKPKKNKRAARGNTKTTKGKAKK